MNHNFTLTSAGNSGSLRQDGIRCIYQRLETDDYAFAPLAPEGKLIRNNKTGGLTSCERSESGRGISDNKGFKKKTDQERLQQAELIYNDLENVMSQQIFTDVCKFIHDQYVMYEWQRDQEERTRYISFINSIHLLIENEKLESQQINLDHIEHCIIDVYQNKTYLLDAFGNKKLLKETRKNFTEADKIFCYFNKQIEKLTNSIEAGQIVDGRTLDWLFKYTFYCRKAIYSILILMGFEICFGHCFNNKEVISGKCSTLTFYCKEYLYRIFCLNKVLGKKWNWLRNQINWSNYNNYYCQNLQDEQNYIAQIPDLLNASAYHVDERLADKLAMLYNKYRDMNSQENLTKLLQENFSQIEFKLGTSEKSDDEVKI